MPKQKRLIDKNISKQSKSRPDFQIHSEEELKFPEERKVCDQQEYKQNLLNLLEKSNISKRVYIRSTREFYHKGSLKIYTNYANSRCENAEIFIKKFTIGILVKNNANFDFVEGLGKNFVKLIDKLKSLYLDNPYINQPFQENSKNIDKQLKNINCAMKEMLDKVEEDSSKNNIDNISGNEKVRNIQFLDFLDGLDSLSTSIQEVINLYSSEVHAVSAEYGRLSMKLESIVNNIKKFIVDSCILAYRFIDVMYNRNNLDRGKDPSNDERFTLNFDYDVNEEECDFTRYFSNIHDESKFVYNDKKNIVLSSSNPSANYSLWLVPIDVFILFRAFIKITKNQDLIFATDYCSDYVINEVKNDQNLYLKKVLINPKRDTVSLHDSTKDLLENNRLMEGELVWPKTQNGGLKTKLTLSELISDHFENATKHGKTKYKSHVMEIIAKYNYLTINKNDFQEGGSVEELIDYINKKRTLGIHTSKNSRLARKISILISSYLQDKFSFSLFNNRFSGSTYHNDDKKEIIRQIVNSQRSLELGNKEIARKLQHNREILKNLSKAFSDINKQINDITDILNNKDRKSNSKKNDGDDYVKKQEHSSIRVSTNFSSQSEQNDLPYIGSFMSENEGKIILEVTDSQLNRKVVRYEIAQKINTILFNNLEIIFLDQRINRDKLVKVILNPIVKAIQYDVNDKSVVRSSSMGYFMAMMYMSLPYHKCFQPRNKFDLIHRTPKSRILFMAKAANWYYKAYYDICRELWHTIGPAIGSKYSSEKVSKILRENLESNIRISNEEVTYNNAYEYLEKRTASIDSIASAVTYITSTFLYSNNFILNKERVTHVHNNFNKKIMYNSGYLQPASMNPNLRFQVNRAINIDSKWAMKQKTCGIIGDSLITRGDSMADNIDYVTVFILAVSIAVKHTEKTEKQRKGNSFAYGKDSIYSKAIAMFDALNKKFLGNARVESFLQQYAMQKIKVDSSFAHELLTYFEKKKSNFENKESDFENKESDFENKESDFINVMHSEYKLSGKDNNQLDIWVLQVLYLKIVCFYYSLDNQKIKKWQVNMIDPVFRMIYNIGFKCGNGAINYSNQVLNKALKSYNDIFPGARSKRKIKKVDEIQGVWRGWIVSGASSIFSIEKNYTIMKKVITIFSDYIMDYYEKNVQNDIFKKIEDFVKKVNNPRVFITEYDKCQRFLKMQTNNSFYDNLLHALTLVCMALVFRTTYQIDSENLCTNSSKDATILTQYFMPFYVFAANIYSLPPKDHDSMALMNTYEELAPKANGVINILEVYKFINSFIIKDSNVENSLVGFSSILTGGESKESELPRIISGSTPRFDSNKI